MDLLGATEPIVADLNRDARALFDAEFAERYLEVPAPQRPMKRTDDAAFGVVVSAEVFNLPGDDPAVSVIQNVAFEEGHEVASARVLVPTAKGTVEVSAWAGDAPMVWRDSVPPLCKMKPGRAVRFATPGGIQPLAQDPAYKVDCMERVRQAIDEAMGPLALLVTKDAPRRFEQGMNLPTLGGAFELPPRYAPAPGMQQSAASDTIYLARVGLPEYVRILEAARYPGVSITGLFAAQKRKKLEKLAEEHLRGMQNRERRVMEVRVKDAMINPTEIAVDTYMRMKHHGQLQHVAGTWWVNSIGEVIRLQIKAPAHVPVTELREHLGLCCSSWASMPGR